MTKKTFPDQETRQEQAYRRLGTRKPVCVACAQEGPPAMFELAHIVPRKFHDDVAVLCSNCHRVQSDGEKDLPYAPSTGNPKMETIGRYLIALSDLLKMLAESLANFGSWLLEQAEHVLPHDPEAKP